MLVLTRKLEESIILGKNIEIKILAVEDGKVKLGISAPKDIEIYRKEIYAEVQEENVSASKQHVKFSEVKELLIKNKKS